MSDSAIVAAVFPHELTCHRTATIYAYDVLMRGGAPFLSNRRVFAVPVSGIPIGIKCDDTGHVYAGCSDGIEIWNAGGMLQAVVEIPGECELFHLQHRVVVLRSAHDCIGGATNFCFGKCSDSRKEIFICAEQRLWHLQFGDEEEAQFQTNGTGWKEW